MSVVDVPRLLGELAQYRREREAASTATAFNLVTFVEDDSPLLSLISERIAQIEARNPLRSILLTCDESQPQVTSEHVHIAVCDIAAPQLRSIVHDLLVPGVRTVVLWAGSTVTDPRFSALGELADVVILFTSRTAESERQMLADIVALAHGPLGSKIRDLAFLRLFAWQDLVAQFFDDPRLADELADVCRVQVHSGTLAEAYYFVGWLASRLQWQPCGKHEFCNAVGDSITVALKKSGAPRRIQSVRLKTKDCEFDASVQKGADDVVCLSVSGAQERDPGCVPMHDVDMVSLIERAIFESGSQSIYAETLDMVGRLLEHLS